MNTRKPCSLTTFLVKALITAALSLMVTLSHAQLQVVTTTGMIADLVKNIGGNQVSVRALMGTGVDPHLYKATQGDLRRLVKADIIFYNGLHLEGKMQDIFRKMARKKAVFAVSSLLPKSTLLHHGSYPDPHIWFDLSLWHKAGERVLAVLIQQDPAHAELYQQNAQTYLQEMAELHHWIKSQVATIPKSQRILITAHDAFGYFGRAYGMEVKGLQGVSTASEFGLQDIKHLKEIIVRYQIKAVFVESSVSPRFIQSLVAGVNAEGHTLTIGGALFSDAMGRKETPEGSYFGMVRHNVNTIVNALNPTSAPVP
ncbi:MAG: zinc ABC transporter solute-binding protein [Gammaproteobacteria bacterium]|nr:zinc ABC transporter solute-binding protein [Gammaproteobacteria bacterium]